MSEIPPLYDGRTRDSWIEELSAQYSWDVRHALAAFSLLGLPKSFLDVGCGLGMIVEFANRMVIDAYGVDQLAEDTKHFKNVNLVNAFDLKKKFSMVWCIEVAEHLDASAHATLCDSLVRHLSEGRGNYLVFSSAYPNQGGTGHLSERPAKYWQDQFALRNLGFRKDLSVSLSLLWSHIDSPLFWLPANVMIFEN